MHKLLIEYSDWDAYALMDSGDYQKLERFGEYVVIRSEPKAWWKRSLSANIWQKAIASYDDHSKWTFLKKVPIEWVLKFDTLQFSAKFFNTSKHLGVFPEQSCHWRWLQSQITNAPVKAPKVLSLFGYTGTASLVAAAAGAQVTHVDASKPALMWARHNQVLSKVAPDAVRWILDDATKFVQKEIRRGKQYDIIILDPPSFGRGPTGELWKVETHLRPLLEACQQLLTPKPVCVLMTLYAIEASALMLGNLLEPITHQRKGVIETGELVLQHENLSKVLPLSIFGRWSAKI